MRVFTVLIIQLPVFAVCNTSEYCVSAPAHETPSGTSCSRSSLVQRQVSKTRIHAADGPGNASAPTNVTNGSTPALDPLSSVTHPDNTAHALSATTPQQLDNKSKYDMIVKDAANTRGPVLATPTRSLGSVAEEQVIVPESNATAHMAVVNDTGLQVPTPEHLVAESLPENSSTETAIPSSRELNAVDKVEADSENQPSEAEAGEEGADSGNADGAESESSFKDLQGISDLGNYLKGRPQVLSIFFMMLLPLGISLIMYCIFNIIRMMEDTPGQVGDEDLHGPASSGDQRQTLGEVMQPNAPKRSYEPLCPELSAPGENECLIALPSVHDVHPGPDFEAMIKSKTGMPIVRVTMTRMADGVPDMAGGGSYPVGQTLERISLVAFKRNNALGFCELQIPNADTGAPMKCKIYRPTGDLFAELEEETMGVVSSLLASTSGPMACSALGSKCYMLTTVSSATRFWIQGDIQQRSLVVVSETDKQKPIITVDSGEELKFNAEETNHYRLRVQPKVDAGVVIMALLAIDRLPA